MFSYRYLTSENDTNLVLPLLKTISKLDEVAREKILSTDIQQLIDAFIKSQTDINVVTELKKYIELAVVHKKSTESSMSSEFFGLSFGISL